MNAKGAPTRAATPIRPRFSRITRVVLAAVLIAAKADVIAPTMAVLFAAVAALIGELGLWVGAGCLGLTIFKKRKAMIDRLLARRRSAAPQA